MIRLAVVGDPVAHSLSPVLQRAALAAAGLAGSYTALRVERGRLAERAAELEREGFLGLNVTMPLKEEALTLAAAASRRARRAGAANTLRRRREGGWEAENTDVEAVAGALREAGWPPGPSLILGAGGAAAGAALALGELGAPRVVFLARNRARGERLAARLAAFYPGTGWEVADWPTGGAAENLQGRGRPAATLLVQATPLGMEGSGALHPFPGTLAGSPRARGLGAGDGLPAAADAAPGGRRGAGLPQRRRAGAPPPAGCGLLHLLDRATGPLRAMRAALEEVLACSAG